MFSNDTQLNAAKRSNPYKGPPSSGYIASVLGDLGIEAVFGIFATPAEWLGDSSAVRETALTAADRAYGGGLSRRRSAA